MENKDEDVEAFRESGWGRFEATRDAGQRKTKAQEAHWPPEFGVVQSTMSLLDKN